MTVVANQLAELMSMSPAALRALWRDTFKSVAPDIGADLLRRGIAFRLQERAHGGLVASAKRDINRLRKRVEKSGSTGPVNAIALKAGTRLVRTWNGRTWHVLVCEDGFEFQSRHYKSLSHIAREITGAHWSGPRFFGLRSRSTKGLGHKVQPPLESDPQHG